MDPSDEETGSCVEDPAGNIPVSHLYTLLERRVRGRMMWLSHLSRIFTSSQTTDQQDFSLIDRENYLERPHLIESL